MLAFIIVREKSPNAFTNCSVQSVRPYALPLKGLICNYPSTKNIFQCP